MKIYDSKITYTEKTDTDSPITDDNNNITFEMSGICYDMGYIIMDTKRWAIDADEEGIKELTDMLRDFIKRTKYTPDDEKKD